MAIYGIDLGTTNSVLGRDGKLLTGLVPSVVNMQTGISGAASAYDLEAARSFKCDISLFKEGELSVAASASVLRRLVQESGETLTDVVISVPAYFTDNQRQATAKAAHIAGLTVRGLINEPTAAAIYVAQNRKSLSLVYDLGGGTFDVSVVDSRFGDYSVQSTDGCILGGDNFDHNLRRWALKAGNIKTHRLTPSDLMGLLWDCRDLKIRVQQNQSAQEMSLTKYGAGVVTLTTDMYEEIMRLTFSDTIMKARYVRDRSIMAGDMYDIILVGGSTRCPYLRAWIAQELGQSPIDLTYDPDMAVALGVSIYAELLASGQAAVQVSDVTKALSIELDDGSARVIIARDSKIPTSESVTLINNTQSSSLTLNLYQGDSPIASRNEPIGQLVYPYARVMDAREGVVEVTVVVEADGIISLSCKELLRPPVEVTLRRLGAGLC